MFKHLPLNFHNRARPAAIASMAAHKQGKFWEFHDLLFENQKNLGDEDFLFYAKKLGLDVAQFEKDLVDPAVAAQVDDDAKEAGRVGARGTPSLYLNGRKVNTSARSTSEIVNLVKSEILKID